MGFSPALLPPKENNMPFGIPNQMNNALVAKEAAAFAGVEHRATNAAAAIKALSNLPYGEALRIISDMIVTRKDATAPATRKFAHEIDRHVDVMERTPRA